MLFFRTLIILITIINSFILGLHRLRLEFIRQNFLRIYHIFITLG